MTRVYKRDLGRTLKVTWLDPVSQARVELADFIEKGLAEATSLGKLVYVGKDMIILEHESCDELGDYVKIHPALVVKVTHH